MEVKQEVSDGVLKKEPLFIKIEPKLENSCDYSGEEALPKSQLVILTLKQPKQEYKPDECQMNDECNIYQFSCYSCSYRTDQRKYLVKHVKRHMGIKPFACFICQFKAVEAVDLRRHLNVHLDSSPYQCSECGFETNRKYRLGQHIAHCHSDSPRYFGIKKVKKYQCDLCSYRGYLLSDVNKHKKRHYNVRPFQCKECSYAAKTKGDLGKHYVVHKDEKPYTCHLCHYQGRRPHHLTSHLRTHTTS